MTFQLRFPSRTEGLPSHVIELMRGDHSYSIVKYISDGHEENTHQNNVEIKIEEPEYSGTEYSGTVSLDTGSQNVAPIPEYSVTQATILSVTNSAAVRTDVQIKNEEPGYSGTHDGTVLLDTESQNVAPVSPAGCSDIQETIILSYTSSGALKTELVHEYSATGEPVQSDYSDTQAFIISDMNSGIQNLEPVPESFGDQIQKPVISDTFTNQSAEENTLVKYEFCEKILPDFSAGYSSNEQRCFQEEENPITCTVCGLLLPQSNMLQTHMLVHTSQEIKCNICGKTYNSVSILNKHMTIAHSETLSNEERPFKCGVCQRKFKTVGNFKAHMRIHTRETLYKCHTCEKTFSNRSNLNQHMFRFHSGEYECKICGERFESSFDLKDHTRSVHTADSEREIEPINVGSPNDDEQSRQLTEDNNRVSSSLGKYKCKECGKRLRTSYNLKVHTLIHFGVKPFECKKCLKKFSSKSSVKRHMEKCREKDSTDIFVNIDECQQSRQLLTDGKNISLPSTAKENLKKGDVHSTSRESFKCNVCEKKFKSLYSLKAHDRIHTGVKPFECKTCLRKFSTNPSLQTHMYRKHFNQVRRKTVHSNAADGDDQETHFQKGESRLCQICGKMLESAWAFNNHCRIHSGEKPFKCETCERAFTLAGTLKNHVRIHSNDKPYSCKECDKQFRSAPSLYAHRKNSHGTADKPYPCNLCEKKFTTKTNLAIHKRTHTGETPFCCSICSRKFSQAINLNRHMLKIHSVSVIRKPNLHSDGASASHTVSYEVSKSTLTETLASSHAASNSSRAASDSSHERSGDKVLPKTAVYKCNFCQQKFSSLSSFRRHKMESHRDGKSFLKCEICQKNFSCSSSLQRHMRQIHNGESIRKLQPNYSCKLCEKKYFSNFYLMVHMNSKHTGKRPFQCNLCERNFPGPTSLTYHKKSVHFGRPLRCEICNHGFSNLWGINYHMKAWHDESYVKKCKVCGENLVTRMKYKRHFDSTHRGIKKPAERKINQVTTRSSSGKK